MSTISQSFFNLAHTNNGYFKSEKQAKFLLDHCQEDHSFTCSGEVYGNPYRFFFICDQDGIMHVEKHTGKKVDIWWKRDPNHEEFLEAYNAKVEIKQIRKSKAAWANKALRIANDFNCNSLNMLLKIMRNKQDEELLQMAILHNKWKNKMKSIEEQAISVLNELDTMGRG